MKIKTTFDPVASGLVRARKGKQAVITPEQRAAYDQLKENGSLTFAEISGNKELKEVQKLVGKLKTMAKLEAVKLGQETYKDEQGFVGALTLTVKEA